MNKWLGGDYLYVNPVGWLWRRAVVYLAAATVGALAVVAYAYVASLPDSDCCTRDRAADCAATVGLVLCPQSADSDRREP